MGEHPQRRLVRKLDLERFLSAVAPQPNPKAKLEQYTTSEDVAATMLYIAYTSGDITGKTVLDLGCGSGRLSLGAAFLGAESVVGIDVDRVAVDTAVKNSAYTGVESVQWVLGSLDAVEGKFDTVLMNPPFGVQRREADRAFLAKALAVGGKVYSLHNHPEFDEELLKRLKNNQGLLQVEPNPFLSRFIIQHGGSVKAVYALPLTIPHLFEFHKKAKHDFIVDLYIIEKTA
jgi:putative methylase